MTVVYDNKPDQIFNPVKGLITERRRGNNSQRYDAQNFNLELDWSEREGAFGCLWAELEKGAKDKYE